MTKINFKKSTTAIITSMIIGLVMFAPMTIVPNINAQTTIGSDCLALAKQETQSKSSTVDVTKARAFAEKQTEFRSKTQGYPNHFNSIFNTWSLDKTTCKLSWNTLNVVYSLTVTNGNGKNVVVTENPA